MAETPFELEASPTPSRAADPDCPQLMKDAFQVWECSLEGDFQYRPQRDAEPDNTERFICLRVENILLRSNFADMLEREDDFPRMAISYGFRHRTGQRRFFFAEHKQPFAVPVPSDVGPAHQSIFYDANRMDPSVRFTEEACIPLMAIPRPFLRMALKGIIAEAKADGIGRVDAAFVDEVNRRRKG